MRHGRFGLTVPSKQDSPAIWTIRTTVPGELATAIEQAFDGRYMSLSVFEADMDGMFVLEAYTTDPPDQAKIRAELELVALSVDMPLPDLTIEQLPPTDWLSASYAAFPPLSVGRFYIYGSHETGLVPAGKIGLCIDAATAFGSGEHATTAGCLMAIDRMAKRLRPGRLLDMGCGTGILAFAMARRMGRPLIAADIDPESVRVARLNSRINGLHGRVRTLLSEGYANPAIAANGPYDLIVANILARPLCAMAGDLRRHLAPGGVAVLSGLLNRQEAQVLAAHRARGLMLAARIRVGVWPTLILQAGRH